MANSVATAADLFILDSHTFLQVLTRGPDGIPEPVDPQPALLRAFYLAANENIEQKRDAISLSLSKPKPDRLLCLLSSPDGPPNRMARVFAYGGHTQEKMKSSSGRTSPLPMHVYCAITGNGHTWDSDASQNRQGSFITGDGGPANIWKVVRIERDVFNGPLFTLSPLVLTGGFPALDLSTIGDDLRRAEITSQYVELQRSFLSNAYRGVISRAKDMTEALIPLKAGLPPSRNFSETMRTIQRQLEDRQCQVSQFTYHLAEKLRLLHQRTHPERTIDEGRPVSPELALTVIQDLLEILRDLGHVR